LSLANFKLHYILRDPKLKKSWDKNNKFYFNFFYYKGLKMSNLFVNCLICKLWYILCIFKGLHNCEPTSDFFDSHRRKTKLILHTCESTSGFFSCSWKKWSCTSIGPQMVSFIHIGKEKNGQ